MEKQTETERLRSLCASKNHPFTAWKDIKTINFSGSMRIIQERRCVVCNLADLRQEDSDVLSKK